MCIEQQQRAQEEFDKTSAPKNDSLMEAMEKVVVGACGPCQAKLFELLRRFSKGDDGMKGGRMMAMYGADGEVVRGGEMREAVFEKGTEINRRRRVDMPAVKELLGWLGDFPEEGRRVTSIADEVCTWPAFERALRGMKMGKGLGIDGFDVYLVRMLPLHLQHKYHEILQSIMREEDYPADWNRWIAMLAMKPGEDPKDMGRRRDLWLQAQSEKLVMRMILPKYDEAAWSTVPGSQAGFTRERNAPEQTLVARLAVEDSMMERKMHARAFVDLGTLFFIGLP